MPGMQDLAQTIARGLLRLLFVRESQVPAANGERSDEAWQEGLSAPLTGLENAATMPGIMLFNAGTKAEGGTLVANGGRVLNVTGIGATLQEARDRAYVAAEKIEFPGGFYRRDIGWRALASTHPRIIYKIAPAANSAA